MSAQSMSHLTAAGSLTVPLWVALTALIPLAVTYICRIRMSDRSVAHEPHREAPPTTSDRAASSAIDGDGTAREQLATLALPAEPAMPAPQSARRFAQPTIVAPTDRPVWIQVLGRPMIALNGIDITHEFHPCARDLLCLVAAYRNGISRDKIIDLLLGDELPGKQREKLNTRVKYVREPLRDVLPGRLLVLANDAYHVAANLADTDMWHLTDSLDQAARANDEEAKAAASREAVGLYEAELLPESPHPWTHGIREYLQKRAIAATSWLAEYEARTNIDAAIALLERATERFAQHEEELYRRLMRLQAGGDDNVHVGLTYRWLEQRLRDELSATPSQETRDLYQELTGYPPPS